MRQGPNQKVPPRIKKFLNNSKENRNSLLFLRTVCKDISNSSKKTWEKNTIIIGILEFHSGSVSSGRTKTEPQIVLRMLWL